ncbi:hypothetical protein IE077_002499 [Cardiosporidium cionae]|uniref:Uncharacterized protein n=1 Tax=Cardiosporidium cionae TaxID=476202 RepID=A0ABQ7JAN4_9APIC|nr:hypothetical protein IE077_002499 [Cardiosporidium cionae]|eukprot:KAF8821060.1 hypothetical protein IE077_002499 [Cardiosporidium cionae]
MLRAFPKLFSTAAAPVKGAVTRASAHTEAVPDVMVTFGVRMNQITFVSHPGVMAVSKLLEMHSMTSSRAILTQENVAAIREFDEELANLACSFHERSKFVFFHYFWSPRMEQKAQIALDHQLPINFMDLEHIDKPNMLAMLLEEKEVLEVARQEVLDAPKNVYAIPKIVESYRGVEVCD